MTEYEEYTKFEVSQFLKEYNKRKERSVYKYDIDFTLTKIDVEKALSLKTLTPDERKILAIYFILELKIAQIRKLFKYNQIKISELIKSSITKICDYLNDECKKDADYKFNDIKKSSANTVDEYLAELTAGDISLFDISITVHKDLLRLMKEKDMDIKLDDDDSKKFDWQEAYSAYNIRSDMALEVEANKRFVYDSHHENADDFALVDAQSNGLLNNVSRSVKNTVIKSLIAEGYYTNSKMEGLLNAK